MICKILQILEENQGELDLYSLSLQLDAQPSAVAGIFQLLIAKGRVVEIESGCGPCDACNLNNQCPLTGKGIKRYQLSDINRKDSRTRSGNTIPLQLPIDSP